MIDANGHRTSWQRDTQGRVTAEVKADSSETVYVYESTTSRLKRRTDAKGQHVDVQYFLDDQLKQLTYPNAAILTATVAFTYDAIYGRIATMTDGIGTTSFTYHPAGALGAGLADTVDGPFSSDVIAYDYDALGRISQRDINGVSTSRAFDALGRRYTETNEIGTFTYDYDGHTDRLEAVTYPNGQTSEYAYFGNSGDRRVQSVVHKNPGAATLSRFDYTYDPGGNVVTWRQQFGSTASVWTYTHDATDQLVHAVNNSTATPAVTLQRLAYGYDEAGNRTSEQRDDSVSTTSFNNVNAAEIRQPGGLLRFSGTLSEAARVTLNGSQATVSSDQRFEGRAQVASGSAAVTITATDANGNSATDIYDVSQTGSPHGYTYDANGNLTSSGTKTYEWDARDQLVRVLDDGIEVAAFAYDGVGRRVRKVSGGATRVYIYDREDLAEERVSGGNAARYVHGPAEDQPLAVVEAGATSYFLSDHLGSIIQRTNVAGQVIHTRQYDPFGRPLAGGTASGFAYTGREWDAETGLYYYRARYYDPDQGRFISRDRAGLIDGPNLYAYVHSRPIGAIDPSGRGALAAVWGGPLQAARLAQREQLSAASLAV